MMKYNIYATFIEESIVEKPHDFRDGSTFNLFFFSLCFDLPSFSSFLCFSYISLHLSFTATSFAFTRELLSSRLVSFLFSPREIENAARKASGEMVALCVSNLCHTVLCAPLRATISQEWLLPFIPLFTLQSPFPTDPPLPFSPTRKIIATALRITRSYLRPVRL